MLGWLVALCFLALLALMWPGSRFLGPEKHLDAVLSRLGFSQQGSGEGARSAELICKPSALAKYLQKTCGTLSSFSPRSGWSWRSSALLQSLYEACWSYHSPVQLVRDHLQLSDEGLVALDWALPAHHKRRRTSSHSTSPVLLIIPNSFGKITRNVLKVKPYTLLHKCRNSANHK